MITRSLLSVSGCRGPRQDRLSSLFRHRIIVCVPPSFPLVLSLLLFIFSYLLFRYTHPIFHSTPLLRELCGAGASSGSASPLATLLLFRRVSSTCLALALALVSGLQYNIILNKERRSNVRILTSHGFVPIQGNCRSVLTIPFYGLREPYGPI